MPEKMRVHAFKVNLHEDSGDLESLLDHISSTELLDRVRTIGTNDVRMEHVSQENRYWYMDFGKFRENHGPGKAARDTPIEGFEFNDDEDFCEETACMFVPAMSVLMVQYNHYGTRVGAIQEYLNAFTGDAEYIVDLTPCYDYEVERKFRDKVATKKFTFSINMRMFGEHDAARDVPLTQALDIARISGGENIEITVAAGRARDSVLSRQGERILEMIRRIARRNPESVRRLEAGVVAEHDQKMEVLDLLEQRLVCVFDDVPIGEDRRFPLNHRYRALRRAFQQMREQLQE